MREKVTLEHVDAECMEFTICLRCFDLLGENPGTGQVCCIDKPRQVSRIDTRIIELDHLYERKDARGHLLDGSHIIERQAESGATQPFALSVEYFVARNRLEDLEDEFLRCQQTQHVVRQQLPADVDKSPLIAENSLDAEFADRIDDDLPCSRGIVDYVRRVRLAAPEKQLVRNEFTRSIDNRLTADIGSNRRIR
nr:hypothetical protein [Paraburkholderia sp.]